MVVCKCRKATKLYCFVHKVPVCGECICFQEHRICVVRTYSEWVIDGEYDWPTKCCSCHANFDEGADETSTVRLGCLHIIHSNCFVSHLQSYPPHTAPAGYVCPLCSTPIWPPKSVKDSGSRFHYKLKEAVSLTGLEKNVFGNHLPAIESRLPPPAFSSEPLVRLTPENHSKSTQVETLNSSSSSVPKEGFSAGKSEIVEVDGSVSSGNQFPPDLEPNYVNTLSPVGPGATTRKGGHHVDRQNSEQSYYADDEDGHHHKYTRRGPLRHKFLRSLLPFWSSNLPILPVTAPPRNDIGVVADDATDGRGRRKRSSRTDPRKILLLVALMACMATMAVLYYRLAQRSLAENQREDQLQ